jgi:hypothetical protein
VEPSHFGQPPSLTEYRWSKPDAARGVKFPLRGVRREPGILMRKAQRKQLQEPYRSMVRLGASKGLRVTAAPRADNERAASKVTLSTVGTWRLSEVDSSVDCANAPRATFPLDHNASKRIARGRVGAPEQSTVRCQLPASRPVRGAISLTGISANQGNIR